jgi:hypothetical protein
MYQYTDPNRVIVYENTADINYNNSGNTGGFNENFNTGLTNYSIASTTYTDNTSAVIPQIELTTNETDFSIVVNNSVDTPFSNNNTKFTINFIRAPFANTDYIGNTLTMAENFCFDRAHNTVGSASVNGDNYGGNYQVLKGVSATFTNSGSITITGKIAMTSDVIDLISESDAYFGYQFKTIR